MTPGASKNKKESERHNWLENYTMLITQAFSERQPFGWNRNNKYFHQKKNAINLRSFFGGDNEIRTRDLCVANASLYQLSHTPTGDLQIAL